MTHLERINPQYESRFALEDNIDAEYSFYQVIILEKNLKVKVGHLYLKS